jgi:hypothetical protein
LNWREDGNTVFPPFFIVLERVTGELPAVDRDIGDAADLL